VTLGRSMGDEVEVTLYRSLRKCLPNLQRLALSLDVRLPSTRMDATVPDSSFDDFDLESHLGTGYLNGHLRDLFINNAMDEALARAIPQTIPSAKGMHLDDAAALSSLKIQFLASAARNLLRISVLPLILAELRSSWLLTRRIRDGSGRDEITATKMTGSSRSEKHPTTQSQTRNHQTGDSDDGLFGPLRNECEGWLIVLNCEGPRPRLRIFSGRIALSR